MYVAGGYECAGFVELPQKGFQYECPICLLILREPHENSCCGYNYCKTCLDSVLNKTCPMCKQEKFTVFRNKGMERSLNCLLVRCVNEKSGCTWKGPLGEYTKHLNENPTQEEQLKGCEYNGKGEATERMFSLHYAFMCTEEWHPDQAIYLAG